MWCISAYEHVVGEANMTKIFAVYLQASGFPSLSSEYALKYYRKQLGQCDISLSYSSPDVDLVAFFVYVDCHRAVCVYFLQEFDVHMFYTLFLKRGQYCLSLHRVEGALLDHVCDGFGHGVDVV